MLLTLDFETSYSKDYSLSKMSEAEYILDARFQTIMVGLKQGDAPVEILFGCGAIAERLAAIDWPDVALLCHNTRFDGAILAWRFGCYPAFYLDSLSMSRAITHWHIGRSSLAKVSEFLGLPPKGDEIVKAQGKRLEDFTREELQAFGCYCARDTDNCYEIFHKLRPGFEDSELRLIDLILRMFIQPQVRLNVPLLEENQKRVLADKAAALAQVEEMPKEIFASNTQFAALLWDHGVTVPMKKSPTGTGEIPALARGDWQFKELCLDDTLPPLVQAMLAARLAVKSTLEETRSRNLLKLARLEWPAGRGWAPIPLKYSGARTHRLSGDGGANWQNLPRGSLLRQAIEAPSGYRIVHRDASQIEARMTSWLAKCDVLLDAFRTERDVYCEFASILYNRPITRDDKLERWCGKTSILGLGYGCGAARFRQMLFIGTGGLSMKVSVEEAQDIVDTYRRTYPEIVALWHHAGWLLRTIAKLSRKMEKEKRPPDVVYNTDQDYAHIPVEPDYDSLLLPSGLRIQYPRLRLEDRDPDDKDKGTELVYDDAVYRTPRRIYGAKGCLGVHTLVLTGRGWVPIVDVTASDRLWDGDEWVLHDGVALTSIASTIVVDGVTMTPNHRVLTVCGWQDGATCQGSDRAPVWLPDRYTARWIDQDGHRVASVVGDPLRLRTYLSDDFVDLLQRRAEILRVSAVRDDSRRLQNACDVKAPGLCGMAVNASPLHPVDASGVGQLWGSGDHSLSRVAPFVRDVLERHGSDVQARPDARAQGQRGWVFSGELRVGYLPQAGKQSARQCSDKDTAWHNDSSRSVAANWDRPHDAAVPHRAGVQPVYDIINAGPQNRFVVAGTDGPFIVHNCENISQALARIIVTDIAVRVREATDYHPFLTTHDSLDYCVPLSEAADMDAELERQFAIVPTWADGLPLASEGGWGRTLAAAERAANE